MKHHYRHDVIGFMLPAVVLPSGMNSILKKSWALDGRNGDLKQYPVRCHEIQNEELYGANIQYESALATWQFANEIKVGDIVYAKKSIQTVIGRGIVESDYIFDAKRNEYTDIENQMDA
jgi:hypothetical protein